LPTILKSGFGFADNGSVAMLVDFIREHELERPLSREVSQMSLTCEPHSTARDDRSVDHVAGVLRHRIDGCRL
jgi:hypothetical protein